MKFPIAALRDLAGRILDGDVVFFVGSGFSIDSEGNHTERLLRRLLVRLVALCEVFPDGRAHVQGNLKRTFELQADGPALFPYSSADLKKLVPAYYEANEWFCNAYGYLLTFWKGRARSEWGRIRRDILKREREIIAVLAASQGYKDPVPPTPISMRLVTWLEDGEPGERLAGKVLFLDTMGFRDAGIMGGKPMEASVREVAASYRNRLLPRHQIIAQLAREGFCSTTVTTNFDQLLEGAFRLAGFGTKSGARFHPSFAPETYFQRFVRIASPETFFTEGKEHRTSVLLKVHGCSGFYREFSHQNKEAMSHYLRSMVFTYREIQNWREDSWAADYLRTLLRTRTVVFCCYSLRDPVIHDTFRTVYEEMARYHGERTGAVRAAVAGGPGGAMAAPNRAPAFFLAPADQEGQQREFHGVEVLQSASRAVGGKPAPFMGHPNYLTFFFRDTPGFPHLDELFQWLFHAVFRLRQMEYVEAFLHRMVAIMFRGPRPDLEMHAVRDGLRRLCAAELRLARSWSSENPNHCRRHLAAVTGWTCSFQAGLLRQFACVEMVHLRGGPSAELALMQQLVWYYPTSQAIVWTCWGVIVELAIRNMLRGLWGQQPPLPLYPEFAARAAESLAPTILFQTNEPWKGAGPPEGDASSRPQTPIALTIRFRGFERVGSRQRVQGCPARMICWELAPSDTPWPVAPDGSTSPAAGEQSLSVSAEEAPSRRGARILRIPAPDAGLLWRWAAETATEKERHPDRLRALFGMERSSQRDRR